MGFNSTYQEFPVYISIISISIQQGGSFFFAFLFRILIFQYKMAIRVPFLDLSREIKPMKEILTTKMSAIVFDQTNFILGKELESFETSFA